MPNYGYGLAFGSSGTGVGRSLLLTNITNSYFSNRPVTVSCWIMRTGAWANGAIFDFYTNNAGFGMITRSTDQIGYYPGTDSLGDLATHYFNCGTLDLNEVCHVAITGNVDGSLKYYKNGTLTTTWALSGTQALPKGISGITHRYFQDNSTNLVNAIISDLRIYNRCLNDSEILCLYDVETRFELFEQNTSLSMMRQQQFNNIVRHNRSLWVGAYNPQKIIKY